MSKLNETLEDSLTLSQLQPMPPHEAARTAPYKSESVSRLHAFCWQLHLSSERGVWYLSCGIAGKLLDYSGDDYDRGMTAHTFLCMMVRQGILEVVEKARGNKATLYRYLPVNPSQFPEPITAPVNRKKG